MMGTGVAKGSGVFEVVSTGQLTKFGEIARLAVETKKVESPLQKELKNIGKFVAQITLALCLVIFVILLWRDGGFDHFVAHLMYAVAIAIAAVPE